MRMQSQMAGLGGGVKYGGFLPASVYLPGCLIAVCVLLLLPQVAPGIAWGLWRPIVVALEPAMAAQLAVSCASITRLTHYITYARTHALNQSLTHSLTQALSQSFITCLRPCQRSTSGQLLEQWFEDREGEGVLLPSQCTADIEGVKPPACGTLPGSCTHIGWHVWLQHFCRGGVAKRYSQGEGEWMDARRTLWRALGGARAIVPLLLPSQT